MRWTKQYRRGQRVMYREPLTGSWILAKVAKVAEQRVHVQFEIFDGSIREMVCDRKDSIRPSSSRIAAAAEQQEEREELPSDPLLPDDSMDRKAWFASFGAVLSRLAMQAKARGCDDLEAAVLLAIRMHDIQRGQGGAQ